MDKIWEILHPRRSAGDTANTGYEPSGRHSFPLPITCCLAAIGTIATILLYPDGVLFKLCALTALTLSVFSWFFESSLAAETARAQVAVFFREERYAQSYGKTLKYLLDATDAWFLTEEQRSCYSDRSIQRAWSIRLFSRTILIACLYPFIAVILQWFVADSEVRFSDRVILYDTNTIGKLLVIILYMVAFLIPIMQRTSGNYDINSGRKWRVTLYSILCSGLATILLGMFFGPKSGIADAINHNWFLGVAISGVLITFALICHFNVFNFILGPGLGIAIGGAVVAVISPYIEAVAAVYSEEELSTATAIDNAISYTLNVVIALAVSIPLSLFLNRIIDKPGKLAPMIYAFIAVLSILVMAIGAGHLSDPGYFILLGMIPFLNAVFDFTSIGLTRWALRSGLKKVGFNTIIFSIFDLVMAFILFILLCISFILLFHLVNIVAMIVVNEKGGIVVNIYSSSPGNIYDEIDTSPANHMWLYITFLTTLIPTIFHSSVAVWAIGPAILPDGVRGRIADRFVGSSYTLADRLVRVVPLSIWSTFALLAPFFALVAAYFALSDQADRIGAELLDLFDRFSRLLSIPEAL